MVILVSRSGVEGMNTVSHTRCTKCREIKHVLDLVNYTNAEESVCKDVVSCEKNAKKKEGDELKSKSSK